MPDAGDDFAHEASGLRKGDAAGGFFSGLFQPGMRDAHARSHMHRASPVETLLFGLEFDGMGVGTENFELTPRIQGHSAVLQLFVTMGSSSQAAILHIVAFALGRVLPADADAFHDLDPIFPFANQLRPTQFALRLGSNAFGVSLQGRFAFAPRDRSIIVRFVNTSTAVMDAWVGIVIEEPH